jgi:hypothetical protein
LIVALKYSHASFEGIGLKMRGYLELHCLAKNCPFSCTYWYTRFCTSTVARLSNFSSPLLGVLATLGVRKWRQCQDPKLAYEDK